LTVQNNKPKQTSRHYRNPSEHQNVADSLLSCGILRKGAGLQTRTGNWLNKF